MSYLKWDKAFAMEQAADDAELLKELVDLFKDSFSSDLALLELGLAEGAPDKVRGAAHSIKGAAASLGISGIYELVVEIEEDSRAGGLAALRAHLPVLKSMREELIEL